jgi:hypothetical protein
MFARQLKKAHVLNKLERELTESDITIGAACTSPGVLPAPGSTLVRLRRREWEHVQQLNLQIIERMSSVDNEAVLIHNKMASFSNKLARFNDDLRALPTLAESLKMLREHTVLLCSQIAKLEDNVTQRGLALHQKHLMVLKQREDSALKAQAAAAHKKQHESKMDLLSQAFEEDMERYRNIRLVSEPKDDILEGPGMRADSNSQRGGEEDPDDLSAIELDLGTGTDKQDLGSFYSDEDNDDAD